MNFISIKTFRLVILASVDCLVIRLLCSVGAAPACALGSACGFGNNIINNNCNNDNLNCNFYNGNPIGAVTIIPVESVVAFVHSAI